MKRRAVSVLVFLLLCFSAGAQKKRSRHLVKLSPRQIAAIIFPSTVSIYVKQRERTQYAGAGFVVGPNLVATCYHLVKHPGDIFVVTPTKDEYDRALDELRGVKPTATVIRVDEETDLALLRVPSLRGVSALKLTKRQDYYIGDPVYTIGNPSGLEGTFSNGIISNFHKIDEVFYLQFTAPISPGSSGGAVVDDQGKVIGIVNSQIREGQNLNFAVMFSHLESLINGTVHRPTQMDNNFRRP